jgi:ubiquinone/menaquinone biosynthesis C-methylase UbiE
MGEGSQTPEQETMKQPELKGWEGEEATKEVKKYFQEGVIKSGDTVLDIGSGFGRNANYLAEQGVKVTAINIDDQELQISKERAEKLGVKVNYYHANATELPFSDSSFDVVMDFGCTHMLPSNEEQKIAEAEAARVLKPEGTLVYFGFSKEHPDAAKKPDSPQFRSLDDIKAIYGNDFDIISSEEARWQPKPEEGANFPEHVGLNIVLKKK